MIKNIKENIKKIVNIKIQYLKYSFISKYNNCLLLDIKKGKLNKNMLIFLTEDGQLKTVNLEDKDNIKISIFPIWAKKKMTL